MRASTLRVVNLVNPWRDGVQGRSVEPITDAEILDRAHREVGNGAIPVWSPEAICDRMQENAPRIAVIGGSSDHPARMMVPGTVARAALAIWKNGDAELRNREQRRAHGSGRHDRERFDLATTAFRRDRSLGHRR